jgi:hypothetical protein
MKVRIKIFEAGIFGMWESDGQFFLQNRTTKELCILSYEEVKELSKELINWVNDLEESKK